MPTFSEPYTGLMPRQDYAGHCETSRAPDYYGLGVRLGIYFAWMQAYIANNFLASEIASASDTNTIFLLVVLIAMIKCSSIKMLEQVDGLILMHLSGGFLFGSLSLWGYRTRRYMDDGPKAIRFFGGFGTHSRLIVSLAVSIYGLWYWAFGVRGGYLVGKRSCPFCFPGRSLLAPGLLQTHPRTITNLKILYSNGKSRRSQLRRSSS